VYLKQFLEQILVDMNKSLGNFNMLRLSYHDSSNAFVIVDDQQTKVADGEIQLTAQNANISELPIFGKKSIAKSIELRTDISSKLGSMIAISANSDPSRQVGLSRDASSFGFVNTDFQDRFISIATDIYMDKKQQNSTKNTAIVNEAKMFDEYIKSIYKYADSYDESKISFATNYYIQKMSILKNKELATRASAMIPVSLNISLDGISGLQMTQLFTIGDSFLPYNYTKLKEGNPFTSIGFAIVGLTHTIENNQWTTSLRTNMSYLRNNVNDYDADKTRTIYSTAKPIVTSGIQNSNVPRGTGLSPKNANATSQFIFGSSVNLGDSIKQKAHGAREASQQGQWQSENAWDLFTSANTPVYAIFDGNISKVNFYESVPYIWGYRFTLNARTNNSFYTHLDSVVVKEGQSVKKGELLGYVGQPPRPDYSWDPHLHIALETGVISTYIDSKGTIL